MGFKKVLLKNTELEACIKIVTDGDAEVVISASELCYKPLPNTFEFSDKPEDQFQQIGAKTPKIQLIHGQWSGVNGNSNFRLYRGVTDQDMSLATHVLTGCVGDTTQLEFDGQAYCADCELIENPYLIFKITGEMTLWFKLRKRDFESFAGEYATYGAFEDDSKRGPYERYENI